jgi:hypothetical protein
LTRKQTLGAAHPRLVICVSLRMAASAEAPLAPMLLLKRLRVSEDGERAGMSTSIDMKAKTRAAAHFRLVICVSLRMAASAEAPLSPMLLE